MDDVRALMRVAEQSSTASHWREDDYTRIFEGEGRTRLVLVAESAGEVLGFLVSGCVGPEWEVENVVVAEEVRRSGLGSKLLAELLDRARTERAESVFLEVRESNQAARGLYQKWGFAEIGNRRDYYLAPVEDAVVYKRAL